MFIVIASLKNITNEVLTVDNKTVSGRIRVSCGRSLNFASFLRVPHRVLVETSPQCEWPCVAVQIRWSIVSELLTFKVIDGVNWNICASLKWAGLRFPYWKEDNLIFFGISLWQFGHVYKNGCLDQSASSFCLDSAQDLFSVATFQGISAILWTSVNQWINVELLIGCCKTYCCTWKCIDNSDNINSF